MKKQTVIYSAIIALSLASVNSFAQSGWQDTSPTGTLYTNGNTTNVGIGTSTIWDRLTVNGSLGFTQANSGSGLREIIGRSGDGLAIFSNFSFSGGAGIAMHGFNNGGNINFVSTNLSSPGAFNFMGFDGQQTYTTYVTMRKNGRVGIGDDDPQDMLSVNESIGFTTGNGDKYLKGRTGSGALAIWANKDWTDGAGIVLRGNTGTGGGDIAITAGDGTSGKITFNRWNSSANPQTWNTNMTILPNGNIAFGIKSGYQELTGQANDGMILSSSPSFAYGSGFVLNSIAGGGDVRLVSNFNGYSGLAFNFMTCDVNSVYNTLMTIDKGGKVVIGNVSAPDGYKLYVQTGILTEKIKVALSNDPTNWSDFVFADDYELRPLNEVESFIKENKHLPEIPSTEEVHKDGLDLAQMDAKLLQKIEELTLYIIQQQKEIDDLKRNRN